MPTRSTRRSPAPAPPPAAAPAPAPASTPARTRTAPGTNASAGAGAGASPSPSPSPSPSAGYSGTPLPRKLGLAEGMRVCVIDAPFDYAGLLGPQAPGLELHARPGPRSGLVHLFVTDAARLARHLASLRRCLPDSTPLWVSWPKKASGVPTTVTEDLIRELALPLGWVDVKVCAVDATWSGLKLVVRKALRQPAP